MECDVEIYKNIVQAYMQNTHVKVKNKTNDQPNKQEIDVNKINKDRYKHDDNLYNYNDVYKKY